jgi:murein DD-endopeptidase MepM/ murein hydrolase activator NlpD
MQSIKISNAFDINVNFEYKLCRNMSSQEFQSIIAQIKTDLVFVIDSSFEKKDYVPIDLSKNSKELQVVNVSSSNDLGFFVKQHIKKNKSKLAYGGYIETRGIYQRSSYFNQKTDPLDERNIHLGLDIWITAGTIVLAALNGEIHSFNNNVNHGDYGPTIIIKHQINNFTFHTLYGHLSVESLTGLEVGKTIKQGDKIAQLGSIVVNGDYPPHLHFQIIIDMEKYQGDYPGVASINTLEFYKKNCPDPNLLLGLGQ